LREERESESVFEAKLRKEKEKKKEKKKKKMVQQNDLSDEEDQSLYGEVDPETTADPFFQDAFDNDSYQENTAKCKTEKFTKKKKGKKSTEELEQEAREKAELELLMLDSADSKNSKGYSLSSLVQKNEEKKSGKKKKRKGAMNEEGIEDNSNFKINTNDDRFKDMFNNPDFAIDPTDKSFKATEAMENLMSEIQKTRFESRLAEEERIRDQRKRVS
jgi:hypothetical protein